MLHAKCQSAKGENIGCWGWGQGWGVSCYFIQPFLGMEGKIQRQASAKSTQATPLSFPNRWPWAVGAASVPGGGLDEAQAVFKPQFPHLHGGALQRISEYVCVFSEGSLPYLDPTSGHGPASTLI